ncbi:ABC transporter substrate-binding protein [Desulforhopalus sp. 52FAK]
MRIVIGLYLMISVVAVSAYANEIDVSVLIASKQRNAYHKTFSDFYQETGIKVNTIALSDTAYKQNISEWLLEGKDTPDVLYWQASQRLYHFAKLDVIHPITDLWSKNNFDENFSHVKSGVTYNNEIYALPFAYYHWGVFYKKSLIAKFGGTPKNWEEFIAQCEKLQEAGITPIGIGTKNNWPAAAWFDYLNLRINGLDFHQQVLSGEISFFDERVQNVLSELKKLIDQKFFLSNKKQLAWDEVLPLLYRDQIGFTLIGNFVTGKLPELFKKDIGFIPFPTIDPSIPLFEEAPMDVFMIAKSSKKIKEAEMFIQYIAQADVQSKLNEALGYLPPNKKGTASSDMFIQAGEALLKEAEGVSQYFDRDTIPAFDKIVVPLLADFLETGDIQAVTENLEKAKKQVFKK